MQPVNDNQQSSTSCRVLILLMTTYLVIFSSEIFSKVDHSSNTITASKGYTLGVFPYLAPRELEKMYAPIAADYSRALDKNVQFMTSSTYKVFMKNLDSQQYDIVFVQPFDYVAIADKYGYIPLATRNKPLPAILVTLPNGNIKNINDLRGKTIALPPPVSAISYLVKNFLMENGINPKTDVNIKHFRSHGSCMQKVFLKIVSACGTAPPALRFFQAKMNKKLNIIAKTPGIPNSIFAIHPRVPHEVRDKLIENMATWSSTRVGKKLLQGVKVENFIPVLDSDYDVVRTMALKYRKK